MSFELEFVVEVPPHSIECESNGHVQQVSYSTYHQALTQVCFGCKKIRTNMPERDVE